MNEEQEKLRNLVNTMLQGRGNQLVSEVEIDGFIEQFRPMFPNMTSEEVAEVRKYLHAANSIRLDRGVAIFEKGHKKWLEQRKDSLDLEYWSRFKQYLSNDKHFSAKNIDAMDQVTDDIVDLLGDPMKLNAAQRRGLVIGDVQSGKTLNYSGVINKAIDVGYRVIILLAGTSNSLREQTQQRIDEAVIGYSGVDDMVHAGVVGVGKYDLNLHPISVTTLTRDFHKTTTLNMSLSRTASGDKPMIFVIKKNVSVLKNLHDWILTNNSIDGQKKIDNVLLLIDDEADYASVNTTGDRNNLTRTNEGIVKLLNMFRFSSYIGFTATPFANVFIDPETDADMLNDAINIFPKDYIYTLEAPSNYIGARDIFGPNSKHSYMLRDLEDGEQYYPLKHKKDTPLDVISPSLKKAINTFLLANTLLDLGQVTMHRSMMVNVSRYVQTSLDLTRRIEEYVSEIKNSVKIHASLPVEEALDDENIKYLFEVFEEEYDNLGHDWSEVQAQLAESILPIMVKVVDGGHKFEYDVYDGKVRVILVGGIIMSRGLTLEGLIVSYLYRNTKMYDTLMQMGRWFGYHDGYNKLCRIFLDLESQNWYAHISDASDELRYDVKKMRDKGATPREFGIKVRTNPELPLLITARNKMRSATSRQITTSFSGVIVEAKWLNNIDDLNKSNLSALRDFVSEVGFVQESPKKPFGAHDVPVEKVLKLLSRVSLPGVNQNFDTQLIARFIKESYVGPELQKWDVVIPRGEGNAYDLGEGIATPVVERKANVSGDGSIIGLNKGRLGSISDVYYGLTPEEIGKVKMKVKTIDPSIKNVPGKAFFTEIEGKRNPLLLIYLVKPNIVSDGIDSLKVVDPILSFAIGFPLLSNVETSSISYYVNPIFIQNSQTFLGEDDQDEEKEDN